jgi:hypothetical protein
MMHFAKESSHVMLQDVSNYHQQTKIRYVYQTLTILMRQIFGMYFRWARKMKQYVYVIYFADFLQMSEI